MHMAHEKEKHEVWIFVLNIMIKRISPSWTQESRSRP